MRTVPRFPFAAASRAVLLGVLAFGMAGAATAGDRDHPHPSAPPQAQPQPQPRQEAQPNPQRERWAEEQRRAQQDAAAQQRADGFRRNGRLTPDERRDLRRQINEAGQDIYANTPRR